jgi:hypothetical protein
MTFSVYSIRPGPRPTGRLTTGPGQAGRGGADGAREPTPDRGGPTPRGIEAEAGGARGDGARAGRGRRRDGPADAPQAVPLDGQGEQALDAPAVQVVLVPGHGGQEALEALLGGAGDDLREGVAVLVRVLGEQAGEVAFQGLGSFAPLEVDAERCEELGQSGQRGAGRVGDSGLFIPFLRTNPAPGFR